MINNYLEFISESKIELILEANIIYSDRFKDILATIDTRVSNKLKMYNLKDEDVDRNYIDVTSKDDTIIFRSQDKINKAKATLLNIGLVYDNLSIQVSKKNNKSWKSPRQGTIGSYSDVSLEELIRLSPESEGMWNYMYNSAQFLTLFEYEIHGVNYECFVIKSALKIDLKNVPKTEISIGRFVRSFLKRLGEDVGDKELEEFVDEFKKARQIEMDALNRFKIVEGEDIRKYYLYKNYYNGGAGNLGSSCMRSDFNQRFLDIYVDNPDSIKMVIFMAHNSDKISGRALLWIDNEGRKIMDRIYTSRNSDILLFKEYAEKNGFYTKSKQDYSDMTSFEINGKVLSDDIVVDLKKVDYDSYPYMDTFKYYLPEKGTISNSYIDSCLMLTDTEGGTE